MIQEDVFAMTIMNHATEQAAGKPDVHDETFSWSVRLCQVGISSPARLSAPVSGRGQRSST